MGGRMNRWIDRDGSVIDTHDHLDFVEEEWGEVLRELARREQP